MNGTEVANTANSLTPADLTYECPICCEKLFPPVFQCRNGHVLCSSCSDRCPQCPVCRTSMPPACSRIRNLEVERIIRMQKHSCPFDGCGFQGNCEEIVKHKGDCLYRTERYCSLLNLEGCHQNIACGALTSHLEVVHRFRRAAVAWNQEITVFNTCPKDRQMSRTGFVSSVCFDAEQQPGPSSAAGFSFFNVNKTPVVIMVEVQSGFISWTPFLVTKQEGILNKLRCSMEISRTCFAKDCHHSNLSCENCPLYVLDAHQSLHFADTGFGVRVGFLRLLLSENHSEDSSDPTYRLVIRLHYKEAGDSFSKIPSGFTP